MATTPATTTMTTPTIPAVDKPLFDPKSGAFATTLLVSLAVELTMTLALQKDVVVLVMLLASIDLENTSPTGSPFSLTAIILSSVIDAAAHSVDAFAPSLRPVIIVSSNWLPLRPHGCFYPL